MGRSFDNKNIKNIKFISYKITLKTNPDYVNIPD